MNYSEQQALQKTLREKLAQATKKLSSAQSAHVSTPKDKVKLSDESKELTAQKKESSTKIDKNPSAKEKHIESEKNKKAVREAEAEAKEALKKAKKSKPAENETRLPKSINRPGIFFIKDMSLNPFRSSSHGLEAMAKNIPGAKVFSWGDEREVVDEIKRHTGHQPIILIGHGVGGDTAVSIANELNQMEHGFRKIKLVVTLDSIGSNNDIIPQNVEENLNIISDGNLFFNDGPNIARKTKLTKVVNELRSEDHSKLDDTPEVQFQIFDKINVVLGDAVVRKNREMARIQQLMNMAR